jgi:hypothetical protein
MTTTNFPSGVSTAGLGSVLETFVLPDPTSVHLYFNDFDTFTAGQWTVTETQAGATQAIINGDGGILSLVNSAASADLNAIQLVNETFAITAGKQAWFKCRFSLSSATNAAAVIGLQITDTTPLAASDGVWFSKAAASTTLNMIVEKSSALTTTAVGTMADGTYVDAGFYYDGVSSVQAFLNGVKVGSSVTTNLPTRTLTISAAVSNGTAAAQTMNVDYILVATER